MPLFANLSINHTNNSETAYNAVSNALTVLSAAAAGVDANENPTDVAARISAVLQASGYRNLCKEDVGDDGYNSFPTKLEPSKPPAAAAEKPTLTARLEAGTVMWIKGSPHHTQTEFTLKSSFDVVLDEVFVAAIGEHNYYVVPEFGTDWNPQNKSYISITLPAGTLIKLNNGITVAIAEKLDVSINELKITLPAMTKLELERDHHMQLLLWGTRDATVVCGKGQIQ